MRMVAPAQDQSHLHHQNLGVKVRIRRHLGFDPNLGGEFVNKVYKKPYTLVYKPSKGLKIRIIKSFKGMTEACAVGDRLNKDYKWHRRHQLEMETISVPMPKFEIKDKYGVVNRNKQMGLKF